MWDRGGKVGTVKIKAQDAVFSRWIEYIPPLGAGDKLVRCARCGKTPDGRKTPYCPYCGSKMENGGSV